MVRVSAETAFATRQSDAAKAASVSEPAFFGTAEVSKLARDFDCWQLPLMLRCLLASIEPREMSSSRLLSVDAEKPILSGAQAADARLAGCVKLLQLAAEVSNSMVMKPCVPGRLATQIWLLRWKAAFELAP